MSGIVEVTLPDIGDFEQVDIIEILVSPGDRVDAEDSIITLESDKATMDIPSPYNGTVKELMVKVGDKISMGGVILKLELAAGEKAEIPTATSKAPVSEAVKGAADKQADVVVLGAGPGGYTAAFRAADLGRKVILIERYEALGGVCLNVGCIPSKALLHAADVINEAAEMEEMGISFGKPKVDLDKLRAGKDKVVQKLTGGLKALAKQRKVEVVHGLARFESPKRIAVNGAEGSTSIDFTDAIIACGSTPVEIPGFPNDDPRLINSTGALELADVPKRMLVVGGGIIGLEMATVYSTLGSKIDVVELQDNLIPGCDPDLVRPLQKRIKKRYNAIMLATKVTDIQAQKSGLKVSFEGKQAPDKPQTYDRVLVSVGRVPNGKKINAEAAGINVDERGFIPVDQHMRTNVPNIYAIGDVVGQPMLAHKATHEAKVAAEVIAGLPSSFDPMTIPSVAYTDPEVAWMGLTETEAKAQGIEYEKGAFPWAASGRALGIGRDEGVTKLLFDPKSKRILGAGITGPNAGELIGETVLALEMGADAEDIGLTIHPHPTLNETICFAAEMAEGSITDLMPPRKR
ncbi:dihydrolipoyl dehydrogenase [Candidatus Thiodiazotropha endoloripes]|uniref:dihydrolipoyl dehydrogenase n=1 Tax=Candidatus Thiodiazotropha endoloripes TaxID=1818881 RepID=UPI00083D58BA|nr:dihydrolipoyl dehydrogenase [Candidatus Thiodiazotropha endoloripes]MCG7901715.1 dihydrolipoyl dehydrogenase [Candidatus Thiodiazotropha weberae]ODB83529.1 dihydrolipoyl dehydrogenase [Candidatus Thiodiazotropha endoloripes]ODB90890.1 dihydrolipoyl dehydrogenase [Candidatus Thiodiazotropha endoloripes]